MCLRESLLRRDLRDIGCLSELMMPIKVDIQGHIYTSSRPVLPILKPGTIPPSSFAYSIYKISLQINEILYYKCETRNTKRCPPRRSAGRLGMTAGFGAGRRVYGMVGEEARESLSEDASLASASQPMSCQAGAA